MIAISNSISIGLNKSTVVVNTPIATAATGIGTTSFTANWNAFSGAQYYLLDVSLSSSFSTFIYQDQVILAPTTSYVVIGLTENTTYYYRVRASTDVYIDPDYLAFFNRVVAAGGFLTIAEQDSTKQLVADLKANSLWTPMKAIYPMVGASAAACAQNLKSSSFTGTFTATGWTFTSLGAKPSTAYMDTNFVPSVQLSVDSVHACQYFNEGSNLAQVGSFDFGARVSGVGDFSCAWRFNDGNSYLRISSLANQFSTPLASNSGFRLASRTSSILTKAYVNNTNNYSDVTLSTGLPSLPLYVGLQNGNGSPTGDSTRRIAFTSFGDGLSDTQASNFYTAVQKFNQSLNRQVGAQIVSDPDAQAYIDRVYTAGGTLTNTEATAVNQLTIDLKSNGTWSSMKAIYPMIGASAAACAQNLKSSSFTGTFTAGWTFASTGVTPNGTSAYMDTGLNWNGNTTLNDVSVGAYLRTIDLGDAGYYGVSQGGNYTIIATRIACDFYVNDNAAIVNTVTLFAGLHSATRKNSTQIILYVNGNGTTKLSNSTGKANANFWFGASNGFTNYNNEQIALGFISDGLDATQNTNFYTSVQNFNQTLDRQVGAQIVSDPDAQSYINRVYTAGGTLTNLEANAVNKLAIDMKAAGLWTSMKAVYPMIGSSAASCAQNLKSSSFTGSFTAGWTYDSTGVTPNGTSAYMDTQFNPSLHLTNQIQSHLSVYSRTQNSSKSSIDIGCYDLVGNKPFCASMYYNAVAQKFAGHKGLYQANFAIINNTDTTGLLLSTRTTDAEINLFQDGTKLVTNTTSVTGLLYPNLNAWLGGYNRTPSSGDQYSVLQCAFASIGDGLTDTQSSNFYTAVQTFNQTLGRSVGSQIVSDADAQAYVNRVYNAGGSLTNTEANAVNQLVLDMKTAGIWTSMKAIYPMVGSSAAACAQNLKSSSFTGTFTAGWTFASTGVTPDGTSAFMNTGVNMLNDLSQNNSHISVYSRTNVDNFGSMIGIYSSPFTNSIMMYPNYGGQAYTNMFSNGGGNSTVTTNTLGLRILSRINSSNYNFYQINTKTTFNNLSVIGTNLNIYIGANNFNGFAANLDTRQNAFSSIGDGLTDVQATALYNATQIFQNTLGRAI